MLLNCGVGEDSWESLGMQGDPISPISPFRKSVLDIHWKDWCWSWNSSTLATSCEELTHWKKPWCWERLKAGEGDDRGWDGWMASQTQWTWVWVNFGSWWWTGRPGVLQSIGSQRIRHSNWTELRFSLVTYFIHGGTYIRRRQWQPIPVLLPGKSHGRRSLVGCSPWGLEESDTTEWLNFHFSLSCIGEGNGNPLQCSCLENPRDGGAWSHRVGHNWNDLAAAAAAHIFSTKLGSNNILNLEMYYFTSSFASLFFTLRNSNWDRAILEKIWHDLSSCYIPH